MADKDPKKKDEKEDSPVQPDPGTTGPNPQENMEGPISSIIKNIAESGDEEDPEEEVARKKKEEEEEE